MYKIKYLFTVLILVLNMNSYAQNTNETDTTNVNLTIDDFYFDLTPSDLSAFTLLNVTGSEISRPTTTSELSAEILSISSNAPNIPTGVALEWTPWHTFENGQINVQNYRKRPLISGLQFSLATISDSLKSQMAWGIKWSYSKSDPLLNPDYLNNIITAQKKMRHEFPFNATIRNRFVNRINALILIVLENYSTQADFCEFNDDLLGSDYFDINISNKVDANGNKISSTVVYPVIPDFGTLENKLLDYFKTETNGGFAINNRDSINKEAQFLIHNELKSLIYDYIEILTNIEKYNRFERQDINKLISDFNKKNWNKFGINVGFGRIFTSIDHTWSRLERDFLGSYLSISIPIPTNSWDQDGTYGINFNPVIQYNKSFKADSSQIEDKLILGARFTFGLQNLRISTEGLYTYNKVISENFIDEKRLTLGIELKAFEGTWFELAVGLDEFITDNNNGTIFSLAKVKYSFNEKRRFGL